MPLPIYAELKKELTESLSIDDQKITEIARTLTGESFNLSDAYSKEWSLAREYSEIYGLSESILRSITKVLSESQNLSDSVIKLKIVLKTFSEEFGFSDSKTIMILREILESISLSEDYSKEWSLNRDHSESFSLSEEIIKDPIKLLSEISSLSDSKSFNISREITESANLSEQLLKSIGREISESFLISDGDSYARYRIFSESIGTSANFSKLWTALRTYSESQAMSDSIEKETQRSLSQEIGLTDSKLFSIIKNLSESQNLSDSLFKDISRIYSETFSIGDIIEFTRIKDLFETLNLDDGDFIKTLVKLLTEEFSFSDALRMATSILPSDFILGPLEGFGDTVTRTPVTRTTDFHGNRTYTDGSTEDIDAIFINPDKNYALDKSGLTEVADAIMYVKGNQTINKYDKIEYDSETYRVDTVDDRQDNGIVGFKLVSLFLIE